MCNLYSLTPKRDVVARFFRVSHNRTVAFEPRERDLPAPCRARRSPERRRRARDRDDELGLLAAREGKSAEAGDQCSRRSDSDEPVLARLLQAAPLPGAGLLLLRAERRREAGDLELVRDQR